MSEHLPAMNSFTFSSSTSAPQRVIMYALGASPSLSWGIPVIHTSSSWEIKTSNSALKWWIITKAQFPLNLITHRWQQHLECLGVIKELPLAQQEQPTGRVRSVATREIILQTKYHSSIMTEDIIGIINVFITFRGGVFHLIMVWDYEIRKRNFYFHMKE